MSEQPLNGSTTRAWARSATEGEHNVSTEAEVVEAGSKAAVRISDPRVFPVVVAVMGMLGVAGLIYLQSQSQAAERAAFVAAIDRNTAALAHMTEAVTAHELAASIRSARKGD